MLSGICLVACAKTKREKSSKAEDLYTSALFRKCCEFARNNFGTWYILSAEYGLLEPDRLIEPYEKTLNQMSQSARKRWALSVSRDLRARTEGNDKITVLAGEDYREHLIPLLSESGHKVQVPLRGRAIGVQLRWLNAVNRRPQRLDHLERFYALLGELEEGLGGKRILGECNGHMDWPERGMYFLFEPEEMRTVEPSTPCVVRVGTHMVSRGSRATLWNRLRTHRGTMDAGGNHRASILRLHVGAAMLAKVEEHKRIPTWGDGQSASAETRKHEAVLERRVSEYIGRMGLLWLAVADSASPASDRAYLEKNSIGLLAGPSGPIDLASEHWLGNWSPNEVVRGSALWNVDHSNHTYDDRFLDVLTYHVEVTLVCRPDGGASIAPRDWHSAHKGKYVRGQTSLFPEET